MKKKIFIVLPHKDQFTKKYAGSASIWVKATKYKKNIKIFGSTEDLTSVYIKKNYFNIKIPKIKILSKTDFYTKKIIKYCHIEKPHLIEIHNRPTYLLNIEKEFNKTNFILVIHNDPLNLKGSISIPERKLLLEKCYKIYFVSSWVEEKFFTGIDKNFYTNFKTIYPSVDKVNKISKKEKIIIFSGKLNAAKGFDKFATAIIKILKHAREKRLPIKWKQNVK